MPREDDADTGDVGLLNAIGRAARAEQKQAAGRSADMLGELLTLFADGKAWARVPQAADQYCLCFGVLHIRLSRNQHDDEAFRYLGEAIRRETHSDISIVDYNRSAADFNAIRRVVEAGRTLAETAAQAGEAGRPLCRVGM